MIFLIVLIQSYLRQNSLMPEIYNTEIKVTDFGL